MSAKISLPCDGLNFSLAKFTPFLRLCYSFLTLPCKSRMLNFPQATPRNRAKGKDALIELPISTPGNLKPSCQGSSPEKSMPATGPRTRLRSELCMGQGASAEEQRTHYLLTNHVMRESATCGTCCQGHALILSPQENHRLGDDMFFFFFF